MRAKVADEITFRFTGGEEFVVNLHRWRDRLRREVASAALVSANRLVSAAFSHYRAGPTGNLRKHVKVVLSPVEGSDTLWVTVRNSARHAHLYEYGTKDRWTTGRRRVSAETSRTAEIRAHLGLPLRSTFGTGGTRAHRGVMPAAPTFVPIAISQRAEFMRAVRRILASPEPALGPGSPDVRETGA